MRVILIASFLLIIAGCQQSPEQQAKQNSRDAISLCWDNQKAKSLPPDQARFIAGACEMMEAKFKTEYNANP